MCLAEALLLGGERTCGRGVYDVVWWGSKHFCHYHVHHSHLVFVMYYKIFPLFLNTGSSLSPDFEFFETRSLSATYFQEPPFCPEIDAHFSRNRSSAWQFIFRGWEYSDFIIGLSTSWKEYSLRIVVWWIEKLFARLRLQFYPCEYSLKGRTVAFECNRISTKEPCVVEYELSPPYPFGMSTTTDQQSPSRDGKADTVSEGTTSTATTDVAPNDPMNSSPQDKQDTLKNKISIWWSLFRLELDIISR